VDQLIRLADAGCDMVRITAQGIKEAANLANIKSRLKIRGYNIPLIADIHFNPAAAETAARIVEKIRINPGNYTDRNQGKVNFSDTEYSEGIDRIRENLKPLIAICRQFGTAVRIGSNHGSLSERIMSRYGDTPEGMVESAIEFIRIFEDLDFRNLVLSMKSSNTRVMVQATRLLVRRMSETGAIYPLHLGVTEAGDGEDGIIKSAAGIGALLADGIGDTIRVSLTGAPEPELPVAKILKQCFEKICEKDTVAAFDTQSYHPYTYSRRDTLKVGDAGGGGQPIVAGYSGELPEADWIRNDTGFFTKHKRQISLQTEETFMEMVGTLNPMVILDRIPSERFLEKAAKESSLIVCLALKDSGSFDFIRTILQLFEKHGICCPVILKASYQETDDIVRIAFEAGPAFIDGLADGLWIEDKLESRKGTHLAFKLLQACRSRFSGTEFISCPSCGRTLFDLEDAVKKIRERTSHLPGITIGVMGCIVNGPGEMADADYGYVGAGKGRITLFKGPQAVKKNVLEAEAVDELIALIKSHGDWKEKSE
jgi:(E)-4-hydroxy-3-methylbut-2-enyl-diphosphate synthase